MTAFDTIISGGRVVDGTGSPAYYADIGIADGKVAAIGKLGQVKSKQVIDARGHYLWFVKENQPTLLADIQAAFAAPVEAAFSP